MKVHASTLATGIGSGFGFEVAKRGCLLNCSILNDAGEAFLEAPLSKFNPNINEVLDGVCRRHPRLEFLPSRAA